MIILWFPLVCGLFFGLIPPRLLLNSECRYLNFESLWATVVRPRHSNQRRRRWWKLPLVWIDPIRGYATAFFLNDAFQAAPLATTMDHLGRIFVTFLVLLLVIWVQTWGRKGQKETLAPCGFSAGLMLGLLPVVVALSAIIIGVTAAIATTHFAAGYAVAALTTAGIGYAFMGRTPWLGACTVLVAAPLLISWLRRTQLVIPVRC